MPDTTPPPNPVILSEAPTYPVILSEAPTHPVILSEAKDPCISSHQPKLTKRWTALLPRALVTRPLQTATLACVLLLTLGASDPNARFQKLGHEMICTCSCGQILLECNHVGCGVSAPMIDELHAQVATGGTNTSILSWFTAKYGATVLAAPLHSGFGNVAWITPFAVFFLATIGTAVTIRVWQLRSIARAGAPRLASETWESSPENEALRDRIRRETEY